MRQKPPARLTGPLDSVATTMYGVSGFPPLPGFGETRRPPSFAKISGELRRDLAEALAEAGRAEPEGGSRTVLNVSCTSGPCGNFRQGSFVPLAHAALSVAHRRRASGDGRVRTSPEPA